MCPQCEAIRVFKCVCICCVRHLPHTNGIYTLYLIPTKSSQLFHPSLFSANTRTRARIRAHTLASSITHFGIHCCHGNGIEHALWHRLFFSVAFYPPLPLCVETLSCRQGASSLVISNSFWMLGCFSQIDHCSHTVNVFVRFGDSSAREHPVVSTFLSCPVI